MTRILIVDDLLDNRYLLDMLLRGNGFETVLAANGVAALEAIRKGPIDLIISDILMPVMDGYQLCRECKKDEKLRSIPFVFYTATYTELSDEKFALSLGADRFLIKPQPPEVLLEISRELLLDTHSTPLQEEGGPLGAEMEFFRQHNAVLFKKLETKMADLNQEIAQRTQTEAELRASEGRFRGLFEQSTTGIAVTGLDGEFLHLNLAFANMLGYTTEEMLQLDFAKVTHPDDVARSFKIFHALLDRVFENYRMEKRYIHKNGGIVWADVSMTLLFDSKGLPQYFIVGSVNITKRMKAELALREHYVLLQALIDSPNEFIIFSLDQQYRYTAFNARHAEEVRKSGRREPKIGIRILDLVDDENLRATLKGSMDRALSGESFIEVERLPESDAYYEFTWAPIPGQDGKPGGLTAFIRDITARRLIEERIRTINLELEDKVAERTAQLEASNRELEAFAYSISHDLRAPLRAIEGFTAILKSKYSERLAPEGQELMERISTGALQMNKLILDILAISKVTRIALEFSRIDMGAMVRQVLGELVPANNAGHISFIIGDLPEVEADPVLLKQVWSNLLSNAIKYSRTRERPDIELGGGTVGNLNAYWVKDNGVGFNPQQVHKLFGMFQRLHPATEFEGTGVGLAIVQRIIHRHGGQVRGESALGQGATFTFTLPGAAPGA